MIKELIKLANELDAKGLAAEADALDKIISQATATSAASKGLFNQVGDTFKDFGARMMPNTTRSYEDFLQKDDDPMDIAVDQEKEKKLNELKKELKASYDWFQANIFVSVDDKFPLITPELKISPRVYPGGPTGWYQQVAGARGDEKAMIIPSGTEFSGLDEDKPIKGGSVKISLRDAWDILQRSMKRHGVQ